MPVVQEVDHGTPAYRRLVELRDECLRRPLGLSFDAGELAAEASQHHFALVDDKVLLGCLVAVPLGQGRYKLRQMAIAEEFRGRGFGRQLVETVEAELCGRGAREFVLHARDTAVGFYEKLGYQPVGELFVEVTIPHLAMTKMLG